MNLLTITQPRWSPSCILVMQGDEVLRSAHTNEFDRVRQQVAIANTRIVAEREKLHRRMIAQKALVICERLDKSKERLTRKTKGRLIRNGLGEALNVSVG